MNTLWLGSLAIVLLPLAGISAEAPILREKTLVVWTSLDRLDQRGGSVLTLEDGADHFDGIVFGEIAPARWMPGSDFYNRTPRDQSQTPPEMGPVGRVLQLAIVYREKEITLYRDGLEYSRHVPSQGLLEFDDAALAGMGKRHRRQADGSRFAGSIDDARIYDRALTPEQLRALKPNESSEIAPWAWWTFDDPQGVDRTGRFPITQLSGGATISGGQLHLDGVSGTVLFRTGKEKKRPLETPARPSPVPADWLTFHLAHPGPGTAMPGDPNCAFYWKGRYHLHYIYAHKDGFAFAHVSSTDLLHWKWHPTTLTPSKTDHGMFSGTGFFTKEGRPAIIYHGQGSGRNQIALALDDQLETWTQPMPVEPIIRPGQDASKIAHWDPDAWLDGKSYYALSGGSPGSGKPPTLFRSPDLKTWEYLGLFLDHDMPDVTKDEDISCPNFFKLGGKDMLLCISHTKGCRYYLGKWAGEKFSPDFHARMNWHGWDFFAPESLVTRDGRRVMWAWCNLGKPQSGIQSLPRQLSLPSDGRLRIRPLRELEKLRTRPQRIQNLALQVNESRELEGIQGDDLELAITFPATPETRCGVEVHAGSKPGDGLKIDFDRASGTLAVGETRAPLILGGKEPLQLRIFVDRNVVEVFANDLQGVVVTHPYDAAHTGIRVSTQGSALKIPEARSWHLKSIYPVN